MGEGIMKWQIPRVCQFPVKFQKKENEKTILSLQAEP
jgi:hypothetical protein